MAVLVKGVLLPAWSAAQPPAGFSLPAPVRMYCTCMPEYDAVIIIPGSGAPHTAVQCDVSGPHALASGGGVGSTSHYAAAASVAAGGHEHTVSRLNELSIGESGLGGRLSGAVACHSFQSSPDQHEKGHACCHMTWQVPEPHTCCDGGHMYACWHASSLPAA